MRKKISCGCLIRVRDSGCLVSISWFSFQKQQPVTAVDEESDTMFEVCSYSS